jgi:predicted RNA-binding Zn-ribbon protein involved in translation (DUF1610 family)
MKCKCGMPLPPKIRTIKEGKLKPIEHIEEYKCPNCGEINRY